MSAANDEKSPIQVGVDLGCTRCRVAYLYPGEERDIVPVPLTLEKFRPVFPILEQVPTHRMYSSSFFPGLLQRVVPEFGIAVSGQPQTIDQLLQSILAQVLQASRTFSGTDVDGLLVARPVWLDSGGRELLIESTASFDVAKAALVTDVECICAFFQEREMADDERATVLAISAGYSGLGMAVVRVTPRAVRVLAADGEQGLLAGNMFDFVVMQSVIDSLETNRIVYSNVRELATWTDFQYRAEMAKLSVRDTAGVEFDVPKGLTPSLQGTLRAHVSGEVFRGYVQAHLDVALRRVDALLAEAGVNAEELSYVLLEGGSMHLPGVVDGVRTHFAGADVHHLSPDSVAGGGALLIASFGAGRTEPEVAFVGPAPGSFFPEVAGVPGLVTLTRDGGPASAPAEPAAPPQATPAAPPATADGEPEETPVEALTLAGVRAQVRNGQAEAARRDLKRLAEAVRHELELLDEAEEADPS